MLFSFKHIDHEILCYHEHIAYFFKQLFHHAPKKFDKDLLFDKQFHKVLSDSKKFLGYAKKITSIYYDLSFGERQNVKIAFNNNTSTQAYSDTTISLVKYDDLDDTIAEVLWEFFDYLWKESFDLKEIEKQFNTVKSHYDKIAKGVKVCPFCGVSKFKPVNGKNREDYDHVLPKAKYPFISINFYFVVPTCDECNTDEKKAKDTPYNINLRRKVYNPFNPYIKIENLEVDIIPKEKYNASNLATLLSLINWEYKITRDSKEEEELETWNEVYRIKGRYKEFVNDCEIEWFSELKTYYKRELKKGQKFQDIKKEFLEDLEYQILKSAIGIVRFSYFNFILALPDIEDRLNAIIAV